MKFEWNEQKNNKNKKKHGISFELATFVFQDPFLLSGISIGHEEERWQSIGQIQEVILYVAYVIEESEHGEEIVRIISAREATKNEKHRYYIQR